MARSIPQAGKQVRDIHAAGEELFETLTADGAGDEHDLLFREHAHECPAAFRLRMAVERGCEMLRAGQAAPPSLDMVEFEARTGLTADGYAGLRGAREFDLRLPPFYRTREVLDFYGRDRQSVSESVTGAGVRKAFLVDGRPEVVGIEFEDGVAHCASSAPGWEAHRVVARMLGLGGEGAEFERRFAGDPLLGALIGRQRGLRIPLTPEPWEALAWAIMGQQISVKAAVGLRRELICAYGLQHAGGLRAHPGAEVVAELEVNSLRRLKFSGPKAEYLISAARAVASGELPISALRRMSVRRAARLLATVRGVGPWTVQYVFLRGLGLADCLPAGDAGLAQGLERLTGQRPGEAAIRETMARYAPWRSLATYHVWASLSGSHDPIS